MPRDVRAARAGRLAPPRTALAGPGRVEPQAGDHEVGVAGVRVNRDPDSTARKSPPHERARMERARDQAAAVERVADRPGAVVSAVLPRAVPAAVAVGLPRDL